MTHAAHIAHASRRRDSPQPHKVIWADLRGKSLSEPLSGLQRDKAILAAYQREVRWKGKRGAYRRVARQFDISDEWCRQIIQAYGTAMLLYYVQLQCQLWRASATTSPQLEREVPPVIAYASVPGLNTADIIRDAKIAADAWLIAFVVLTWLAVWLCWVPMLNGVLGGAALVAGHMAADAGRVYRDVR